MTSISPTLRPFIGSQVLGFIARLLRPRTSWHLVVLS